MNSHQMGMTRWFPSIGYAAGRLELSCFGLFALQIAAGKRPTQKQLSDDWCDCRVIRFCLILE